MPVERVYTGGLEKIEKRFEGERPYNGRVTGSGGSLFLPHVSDGDFFTRISHDHGAFIHVRNLNNGR